MVEIYNRKSEYRKNILAPFEYMVARQLSQDQQFPLLFSVFPASALHPSSFYLYKACVMRLLVCLFHPPKFLDSTRLPRMGSGQNRIHACWLATLLGTTWRGSPVSWMVTHSIKPKTQNWCHLILSSLFVTNLRVALSAVSP